MLNFRHKKYLISLFTVLFTVISTFAQTGLLAEDRNLKYIQTEYFDIIFPDRSLEYATHLAENADLIYEQICNDYGIIPQLHLPVTVTPDLEVYNAYASSYIYNHIVMFDTMISPDLAVYKDNNLDVFKHELTHIVTSNLVDNKKRILSNLYASSLSPAVFTITRSLTEGASIASESRTGAGRLNDGFYLHTIRQMKLENRLPSWARAQGNNDTNIYGSMAYSVGGPFVEYLQNTYGMDKYAEFNYECLTLKNIYISSIYKKVYGISLDEIWKGFCDSIKTYNIPSNPLQEGYITDFFNNSSTKYSSNNLKGSTYESLNQSNNSLIYIDDNSSNAFIASIESDGTIKKPRKLYSKRGDSKASISTDGAFIAVNSYDNNHSATKQVVSVYDVKTKKWLKINETGLTDPAIIKQNNEYYLVAVKFAQQNIWLNTYKLNTTAKGSLSHYTLVSSLPIEKNALIYSLTPFDTDNQKVALICLKDLTYTIRIYDGQGYKEFTLPKNYRIRGLNYNPQSNSLSFSYVTKDIMPRLAYITFEDQDNATLYSMDSDISGGVYNPIIINDKAIYLGRFVDHSKLLQMDLTKVSFTNQKLSAISVNNEEINPSSLTFVMNPDLLVQDYVSFAYVKFKPFFESDSFSYAFGTTNTDALLIGGSIILNTPWDGATTKLFGGWNPLYNIGEAGYSFSTSTASWGQNFNFSENLSTVFETEGFKQVANLFGVSTDYRIGNNGFVKLLYNNQGFVGKPVIENFDYTRFFYLTDDDTYYYYDENVASISIGSSIFFGGFDEYLGYSIKATYTNYFLGSIGALSQNNYLELEPDTVLPFTLFQNIYPTITIDLPKLIPVDCRNGFSYNLPLELSANLTPSSDMLLSAYAEACLFEMEIQQGLKGYLPLYFNRVFLNFKYDMYLGQDNGVFPILNAFTGFTQLTPNNYADAYSLIFNLDFGLNAGSAANPGAFFTLNAGIKYTNQNLDNTLERQETRYFRPIFGINGTYIID